MAMKDTYGFKAKQMGREKIKDMIGRQYSDNERKDLVVLTMPGHESYEIDQIWGPLGIPMENIYAVENNPKAYKLIKEANSGINLLPRQSIDDLIENTDMKFDIMNLDFQGYFTLKKSDLIEKIVEKGLLSDNSVLATWFSGRRENRKTQDWRDIWNYTFSQHAVETIEKDPLKTPESILNSSYARLLEIKNGETRNEFISKRILLSFLTHGLESKHHPYIETLGDKKDYIAALEKNEHLSIRNKDFFKMLLKGNKEFLGINELYKSEEYEIFKEIRKLSEKRLPIPEELKLKLYASYGTYGDAVYVLPLIKRKIKGSLGSKGISLSQEELNKISFLINDSPFKNYFLKENESYFYHSDKGTPMYLDINSFFLKDASKIMPFKIRNKKIIIPDSVLKDKKLPKKIQEYTNLLTNFLTDYLKFKKREELIPEQEKVKVKIDPSLTPVETNKSLRDNSIEKKLSKQEVYSLLREGKSKQEILHIDPSLNPRTISAYKAHLTMDRLGIKKGRPKKNKLETKVLDIGIHKEEVKKFSKEDAIYLLKEGFTPKEIITQYSDEFTLHQLAAFQAWYVTMGKQNIA